MINVAGNRRTSLVFVVSLDFPFFSFAFTRIESKSKLNTQSYEHYNKIPKQKF